MNTLVWQVCKCGLSTIFTDRETMDVDCPQCNSPIAPSTQPHSIQSQHYNSVEVFLHLVQDVYKGRRPQLFDNYRSNKEVKIAMNV